MYKTRWIKKPLLTAVGIAALSSTVALAQQTTSAVRGHVTDENGRPLANSEVIVRNERTGLTRTLETNANGEFAVRNLPVGADYSVEVRASGYTPEASEGVLLHLGQTADLSFALASSANIEEVRVIGTPTLVAQVAVGPSATFGLEQLETAPSINRNIADVLRADARIYVDESRGDINSVSCNGQNPRYNSLTVDGVRMNDAFGLNSNGYPTERMPFSYDAIAQVSVELAPYDVEYGGFTACNINAVTKSGGNEFSGSAFYDYTGDSMRGDSLEGDPVEFGDYSEKRYGFNVGGPIVEDKFYFFAAYEKLEGTNLFDRGVQGSGAVNEVQATQAEIDEIARIARDLYQYEPGEIPSSQANNDEKLLVKMDWNISNDHRLAFTYNWNDGNNFTESDSALNELEFANHLYERGAELTSYTGTLYSNWNDRFSTEFRLGMQDLDNRQIPVGGTDFGEIRVELDDVDVYLGADDSRHANDLNYDVFNFALKGKYDLGSHFLTFGIEREDLDIFNMFVQHVETEIRFDGIDNFENGTPSAIYYNNAPSGNPEDAAADWGYALNTTYLQDEMFIGERLTLVAGLRYDWYSTSNAPAENADFTMDYGFSNTATLDGVDLLQPRIGLTYELSAMTTLRGGIGLFSGGNPNVWLSNTYSNNNVLQFGARGRDFGYTDGTRSLFDADVEYQYVEEGAPAGPGWGVPGELADAVAAGEGSNFEINYLDPNFELPSEWKLSMGVTHLADFAGSGAFGGEFLFNADLQWSEGQDTAMWLRGDLEQVGETAAGRPIYESPVMDSFVLTNSEVGNQSFNAAMSVAKEYENGFDWTVGYAYSDAEDVQPMSAAVAFSNYQERAFFDPQEDVLSTSSYNIAHRFVTTLNWEKYWWGNNATRISLYGSFNEGAPYSYVYDDGNSFYGFTPYLEGPNTLPVLGERNGRRGSWWGKVDMRVEQELPGFSTEDRATAFIVVDNLTNLLNDDWGVLNEADYPNVATIGSGNADEPRVGDASLYEVRIGVSYNF